MPRAQVETSFLQLLQLVAEMSCVSCVCVSSVFLVHHSDQQSKYSSSAHQQNAALADHDLHGVISKSFPKCSNP